MELDPDRAGDAEDRVKAWLPFGAERLREVLATQPRPLRNFVHADGARNVAQRPRDARGIIRHIDQPCIQIGGPIFARAEESGDVEWSRPRAADGGRGRPTSPPGRLGRLAYQLS